MSKHNTREKEPISDAEDRRVLSAAMDLGGEYLKCMLVLRWTGMHVSVLAEPILYDLHIEKEDGSEYIVWRRTKKSGKDAYVSIKAHPQVRGHMVVGDWVQELRERRSSRLKHRISRQYFYGLIKEVGYSAGIPDLSPMSFRHTFGVWLLNQGAPEEFVRQKLNVSHNVMRTYVRYTRQTEQPMYKRLGW